MLEGDSVGKLYTIGEVLIDFIPLQKGCALKDVVSFERAAGGAPANVAAAVAKFGEEASMITKLGNDAFGDFLLEQLQAAGVQTDQVLRTSQANTGLAFVSLMDNGERDFSFYRNPSSDLLLTADEVNMEQFKQGDILHFGSVDLVDSPMKQAHIKAIEAVQQAGGLISFDPNVRLPLWDDPEACRQTILSFIPLAHLIKISEEEIEFITGIQDEEQAVASLFKGNVRAVIYTKGAQGAVLHLPDYQFNASGYKVEVQDATGAGDAFVGGFLYQLLVRRADQSSLKNILLADHNEILRFANASGALTTTGKGAIPALPSNRDVLNFINGAARERGEENV